MHFNTGLEYSLEGATALLKAMKVCAPIANQGIRTRFVMRDPEIEIVGVPAEWKDGEVLILGGRFRITIQVRNIKSFQFLDSTKR